MVRLQLDSFRRKYRDGNADVIKAQFQDEAKGAQAQMELEETSRIYKAQLRINSLLYSVILLISCNIHLELHLKRAELHGVKKNDKSALVVLHRDRQTGTNEWR